MRTLPEGEIVLVFEIAWTTSSGDMPKARSLPGSTRTTSVRAPPPNGGGAETPSSRENIGRMRNSARSAISSTERVSLENTR